MKSFLILLLFLFVKIETLERCVGYYINFEKNNILGKIRNNSPQLIDQKIKSIFSKVYLCAYREYPRGNGIVEAFTYKRLFKYLFKDQNDLTSIHKQYCNHGKESSIKFCLNTLGTNYKCDALINTFGSCVNDLSDPNKYY